MKLSERGAIRSAIADGGFHLYPAGKLIDIIISKLSNDNLSDNFNPSTIMDKLSSITMEVSGASKILFDEDMALLKDRLSKVSPEYDIDSVFNKMIDIMPTLAKRYYDIDDFSAPRPQVVEYYFEGYNDMYKDGDWTAFNVNVMESKEMNVPVGTYFKRSQVSPGAPEFVAMHEANHAMQERAAVSNKFNHYVPWMDEGSADILARLMLFRATEDENLLMKLKRFFTEVEVTDPRKVTYHYGEETMSLVLLRGRLPFLKALMKIRRSDPFSVDWNAFANMIKEGFDPHVAIIKSHDDKKGASFLKKLERMETAFRKGPDLDKMDLKILSMFLATQPPACVSADEYRAALWLANEIKRTPNPHFVEAEALSTDFVKENTGDNAMISVESVKAEAWKKFPELKLKILIRESDIPNDMKDAVSSLAAKYFIVKRMIGDEIAYETYGGGLPYRLGTGEIRCTYELEGKN